VNVRYALRHPIRVGQSLINRVIPATEIAPGVWRKSYPSYQMYLRHQAAKLERRGTLWLAEHDERFAAALSKRLGAVDMDWPTARVLCLGARLGTEVRVFRSLGAFAVGIDLQPGPRNPWVMYGDFHDLSFADGTADVVYTNCLDHVFDLAKVAGEVVRVLRPRGLFLTEIVNGKAAGVQLGYYDAAHWERVEDVLAVLERAGLTVRQREPQDYPGGRMWVVATSPDDVLGAQRHHARW
jgi:SAM-dependent methyltransferase